jgi:hypothetical protein
LQHQLRNVICKNDFFSDFLNSKSNRITKMSGKFGKLLFFELQNKYGGEHIKTDAHSGHETY